MFSVKTQQTDTYCNEIFSVELQVVVDRQVTFSERPHSVRTEA